MVNEEHKSTHESLRSAQLAKFQESPQDLALLDEKEKMIEVMDLLNKTDFIE